MARFFLCILCCLSSVHGASQLEEMTVQGRTEAAYVGNIGAPEIKQKQQQNSLTLLNTHPSIEIKNTGGLTPVFMRGAKSDHTLVIINGLVANNPSANNQFDFSALDPNDIEKIEIITGPKALYYGSGALGGVLKITTKKAGSGSQARGRIQGGSFQTRQARVALGHRTEKFGIFGSLTTGQNGQGRRYNPHHKTHNSDRYDHTSGSLFWDTSLAQNHQMDLYTQGEKSRTAVDDYVDGLPMATGFQAHQNNAQLTLRNSLSSYDGRWQNAVTVGLNTNRRKVLGPLSRTYIARREAVDYQSNFEATNWLDMTAGMGYERESDHSHHLPHRTFDAKHVRAKASAEATKTIDIFTSGRLDKHEGFRAHGTWQTGATWQAFDTTTLQASMGTGFKAPSIQTFVGSGPLQRPNPDAKPERSFLWEVSAEQSFWRGQLTTKATYFKNTINDILVWDPGSHRLINKDQRTISGLEFSTTYAVNETWHTEASLTVLRAFDRQPAQRALNIPRIKTSLSITYAPTTKLSFFIEAVHKSRQMNYNDKHVAATLDVRLGAQYAATETIEIFGRVENVLNEKTEEIYGFGRRGTGFYAGLNLKI